MSVHSFAQMKTAELFYRKIPYRKLLYPKASISESFYIYEWKIITEKKIDTQKKIS